MEREDRVKLYIRLCQDSGFKLSAIEAAKLAASLAGCNPLEIMGDIGFTNLCKIADGSHPSAVKNLGKTNEL